MPHKENNRRIYPGESSRNRPDRAESRRNEARDRQKKYDELSVEAKIDLLDGKLGFNQGAINQRARLKAALEKAKTKNTTLNVEPTKAENLSEATLQEIDAINQEHSVGKKKLKAKDRRKQEHKTN